MKWNSPLYVNVIDYENAFAIVKREILYYCNTARKEHQHIRKSYKGNTSRVFHVLVYAFEMRSVVRHSCLLSPALFMLVMD
ncbi:hypothetical protein DPMN_043105 [Dreissena polymorpha]|uniref:Uncharacterized protein n=1 Tax=Dreissena polymorpha TaxID=45954 RepID=A0A9D4D275_DREPO|nr:hypothetical protein DPMN_043105 [Dreissena polymorpha]